MSYSKSSSRVAFENRARYLSISVKEAHIKRLAVPESIRNLVLRAAILDASAALEQYFEILLEDYQFNLRQSETRVANLPEAMWKFHFVSAVQGQFHSFTVSGDERKIVRELDCDALKTRYFLADAKVDRAFDLVCIVKDRKYPSVKNWKGLFFRLGLNDGFASVDRILRRDSKLLLRSFNDVRSTLAHGGSVSLTPLDVTRHLKNLQDVVRAIDRVLFGHLCKHSGKETWPCGSARALEGFSAP
jgi:hypothetical protein